MIFTHTSKTSKTSWIFLNSCYEQGNLQNSNQNAPINAGSQIQNTTLTGESKSHNDCISRFKIIRLENFDDIVGLIVVADELFECIWPFCGLAIKRLTATETKLDNSFPESQFLLGFSLPYRLDRKKHDQGLILTKCWQNIISSRIFKLLFLSLSWITGNASGYCTQHFVHPLGLASRWF